MHLNIPYQTAFVRKGYIYKDIPVESKEVEECWIFAVNNIINRPLLFHTQIECGAVYSNLPLSAFTFKKDFLLLGESESEHLSNLQWWDCQSHFLSSITFAYLQHKEVEATTRSAGNIRGRYLFTLSPEHLDLNVQNVGYQEYPDVKLYHFIKLDNGFFGVYPNNFLRFFNADFVPRGSAPSGPIQRNEIELFSEWSY